MVASDRRIVDGRGPDDRDAAAHADPGKASGAGATGSGTTRGAAGTAACTAGGSASIPPQTGRESVGLVGGDDIGGLGLLRSLLRTEPGLKGEGTRGRVEDAAALADAALAAITAVAAGRGAARCRRSRSVPALPPPPPFAAPPSPPLPPTPLLAWLLAEIHGHAREGSATGVEQSTTQAAAGGAAGSSGTAEDRSATPTGAVGTTVTTGSADRSGGHLRRYRLRHRWPDC